jgi:hypothetical protein
MSPALVAKRYVWRASSPTGGARLNGHRMDADNLHAVTAMEMQRQFDPEKHRARKESARRQLARDLEVGRVAPPVAKQQCEAFAFRPGVSSLFRVTLG